MMKTFGGFNSGISDTACYSNSCTVESDAVLLANSLVRFHQPTLGKFFVQRYICYQSQRVNKQQSN